MQPVLDGIPQPWEPEGQRSANYRAENDQHRNGALEVSIVEVHVFFLSSPQPASCDGGSPY